MSTDLQPILDRLDALERQQAELKRQLDAMGHSPGATTGTPGPDGNPPPSPHAREVTG